MKSDTFRDTFVRSEHIMVPRAFEVECEVVGHEIFDVFVVGVVSNEHPVTFFIFTHMWFLP